MAYHVDFLPIGDSQCGEAIALHIGELDSKDRSQRAVIIIDGGYEKNGDDVVAFVKNNFNTDVVDLVVSTHPDQDHINGLTKVLEELDVKALWMHRPWMHSDAISSLHSVGFKSPTVNDKLEKALSAASKLEEVADAQRVPIIEPFVDEVSFETGFGRLSILGPTREFYETLMAELLVYEPTKASFLRKVAEGIAGVFETHTIETLQEGGTTSPQNNSSTVLLFEADDGKRMLFAGDAGIEALEAAHKELVETHGHHAGQFELVQVPHHGSRRNVSPSVLDKFLGERTEEPDVVRGYAVVSVSKDTCKQGHPKKVVTNAFKRRGYPVHPTAGQGKLYNSPQYPRDGYGPSVPLAHFDYVEAQD